MGFGLGVYVGTIYDCKPTVTFISTCLKNNIPKDALPKKKDENYQKTLLQYKKITTTGLYLLNFVMHLTTDPHEIGQLDSFDF